MVLNVIEWYYQLQLRIPLSPTEIPLNGPTVLNGIQWPTIGSFFQGHWEQYCNGIFCNMSKLVYDT